MHPAGHHCDCRQQGRCRHPLAQQQRCDKHQCAHDPPVHEWRTPAGCVNERPGQAAERKQRQQRWSAHSRAGQQQRGRNQEHQMIDADDRMAKAGQQTLPGVDRQRAVHWVMGQGGAGISEGRSGPQL